MQARNYPRFIYHKDFGPVVVKDAESERALGVGWSDTYSVLEGEHTNEALAPRPYNLVLNAVRSKKPLVKGKKPAKDPGEGADAELVGLVAMSIFDLRNLARARNIPFGARTPKKKLIEDLKERAKGST